MADVVISNEDITVLAPPEVVELLIDIGPTGQRGTKFFTGIKDPNTITTDGKINNQEILLYDIYLNTAQGSNYGFLYQYVSDLGTNSWVQVLKINPTLYSKKHTVMFTAGEASLSIPVSNIVTVSGTPLTASNFNIQYTIENTLPIASSIDAPVLSDSGTTLSIGMNAAKLSSGTWSNLTGEVQVHLFISIM